MELHTTQIEWRGQRVAGIAPAHILHVIPEPEYPHGRKGREMAELWMASRGQHWPGVLWIDPDVAADPDDLAAMTAAVEARPAAMHTGLVKLWPASTGRPEWIWSHRGGVLGSPEPTQEWQVPVAYVSTGFLWTPGRLLDLAAVQLHRWRWEEVDVGLSEVALRHDIPIYAVPGCTPKHLHF